MEALSASQIKAFVEFSYNAEDGSGRLENLIDELIIGLGDYLEFSYSEKGEKFYSLFDSSFSKFVLEDRHEILQIMSSLICVL